MKGKLYMINYIPLPPGNSDDIIMCFMSACSLSTEGRIRLTEAIEKSALEYRFPRVILNCLVHLVVSEVILNQS